MKVGYEFSPLQVQIVVGGSHSQSQEPLSRQFHGYKFCQTFPLEGPLKRPRSFTAFLW